MALDARRTRESLPAVRVPRRVLAQNLALSGVGVRVAASVACGRAMA